MKTIVHQTARQGFTLIELLITLAIIAIVAAFAYPSYQDHIRKARRAEAKVLLLEARQWMERFYTENDRYDRNRLGQAVVLPALLQTSPAQTGTQYYTMSLAKVTAGDFLLEAVPVGDQRHDACGTLSLASNGRKSSVNLAGYADIQCW